MSIEGRIAVDVSFADTATSSGVQSLKKISLMDTDTYTTGKVAVVTGTLTAPAGVTISWQPMSPEYKDASGSNVSFTTVSRVMFQCTRDCTATDADSSASRVRSAGNVSVSDWNPVGSSIELEPQFTSGTASYTLVLYGT